MIIPQGDWIVVERKVRGQDGQRGRIIKAGLKESTARSIARDYTASLQCAGRNYWPMHKSSY